MITREEENDLRDLPRDLVEGLKALYSEPGRFYHGWSHILACLRAYKDERFEDSEAVRLAILFHDVVYRAGRPDNEKLSADLAVEWMDRYLNLHGDRAEKVARFILMTKNHWSESQELTPDARLFLDIDIGILGQPWPVYQGYASSVRKEWLFAKRLELVFDLGRFLFIEKLLRRKSIFLSEKFESRLGGQARANLQREADEILRSRGFGFKILIGIFRRLV